MGAWPSRVTQLKFEKGAPVGRLFPFVDAELPLLTVHAFCTETYDLRAPDRWDQIEKDQIMSVFRKTLLSALLGATLTTSALTAPAAAASSEEKRYTHPDCDNSSTAVCGVIV